MFVVTLRSPDLLIRKQVETLWVGDEKHLELIEKKRPHTLKHLELSVYSKVKRELNRKQTFSKHL